MSNIIEIQNLNYTYLSALPYEHQALKNITFSLKRGDCLGLFGYNGSGKSTLAKILNGLLCPTAEKITVCGIDLTSKHLNDRLWEKVGFVFQYPEKQIFKPNVYEEVAYGPRNLGFCEPVVRDRVYEALEKVGLRPDLTEHLSPFNLSGGMRRRIAIAGILAINPQVLIMDEPMAGLDSIGRTMVCDIIKNRQENRNTTIVISHDLKEIINLIDRIVILDDGSLILNGIVDDLLTDLETIARYKFELPDSLRIICALIAKGVKIDLNRERNISEAVTEISRFLRENPGE